MMHKLAGNTDQHQFPLLPRSFLSYQEDKQNRYIMKMLPLLLFFLLTTTVATTQASSDGAISRQIHLLRPQTGSQGRHVPGISCMSWRLGVETHNIVGWTTIPAACERYVGNYMLGHQYRQDSRAVTNEALLYAKSLNLTKDGKNLWVFDIDETSLSNLPYYAHHGFGVELYNSTAFNAWVLEGKAPALPESLKLYNKLLALGIKVAFITGRGESQRSVTEINLRYVGYLTWEKLILKNSSYTGNTSVVYKSSEKKKLEESGYRIIGNIGDQWSDLLGTNVGDRTFKLPDPMYYIS
uniref:stem 28 kDa glycoprotein-like n=1 Tax=Fragaria vesca subsp. vesca TaxID=101020 RepID=UPI0005CA4C2A|nr:PREDICTED: stem 28 kDa glycoprotein-like [Fragaria vesca subsp. vesca]